MCGAQEGRMRCMGSTGRHAGSSRTGARDAHVARLDLRAEIAAARARRVADAAEAYTSAGERVHSRPVLPTMGTLALWVPGTRAGFASPRGSRSVRWH